MNVNEAMAKWEQLREMYDMPEWPRTAMDVLIAEVERLRGEVQRLDIAGTHSCHDDCPKLPCVQRRKIDRLKAELAAAKAELEKLVAETIKRNGWGAE